MDGTLHKHASQSTPHSLRGDSILNVPAPTQRQETLIATLLLLLQPVLFFRSVVISRTRHIPFDIEGWHLPIASFMARCLREHILPFWNPYSACGAPGYADIQAQAFYPVTWIAILLGNLSQGHKLFFWLQALVPLHMGLGGLFLFFAMRRLSCTIPAALFAGSTYELSAFFASQAQHLGAICCAAWFPLLIWCVVELGERWSARWIGITSIATALSILSGFPQCTVVAVAFAVFFAIALMVCKMSFWRSLLGLLAGIALGTVTCAAQLIPTLQAVNLTIAKLRPLWLSHGGGLPVQSLVSFFLPNHYQLFDPSYNLPFNVTFLYIYCGHIAALLLVVAPLVLFLRRTESSLRKLVSISLLFVVVSTVWMLGEATPIYESIYERLGSLKGSLYAGFALMAFCLWVAVTAALVLQMAKLTKKKLICWSVALLAAINLIAVSSNRPLNTSRGSYRQAQSEYATEGNPAPVDAVHQLMGSSLPAPRIDFVSPDFWPLRAGADMYRIYSAVGDDPFNLLRYYYFRLSFSGQVFWDRIQMLKSPGSTPWVDAINDGFLVTGDDHPLLPAEKFEETEAAGLYVWKNRSPLPRFYLVDHVVRAATMEQARALLPKIVHPADEAIVENLDAKWQGSGAANGTVRVTAYEQNRVELLVQTNGPAYLVTSETFYPGWHAVANGKPATLLATNLAFRGMPVDAGLTRVEMTFRPDYLLQSLLISLVGLLVTGFLIGGRWTKDRNLLIRTEK